MSRQRLMLGEPAPSITVRTADPLEVAAATARAGRVQGVRSVEAAAAPFLYGSPLGRRFLSADGARALARGDPPARCPAVGLGFDPDARATGPAAAAALGACARRLRPGSDCRCRLLAVNDTLLAEPEAFAYAPGVSGRLVGVGDGRALAIEERATDDPSRTLVAFFGASGPVAVAELTEDGGARLIMVEDGAFFEGAREPRGWRRGRLTERLLLTGPDGRRLIALIGFEPADIAVEGAALAAWPGPSPGKG